ncbi:hypothetical protein HDIA_4291 [Hartmannibacter diazotrophicus]|uniref:PepSY domain-containing protein n=1 Tax=Hartmannibacter diazotrophicus TaxID=1482074 RepID=A0A2C9DBW4_9HYPH|nr:hypothetical protein [Hartmannibacter diazotrophicus]SON57832.1 hypothetical protein HDIA_4291 [Hartmannibacter diazotrophicus]
MLRTALFAGALVLLPASAMASDIPQESIDKINAVLSDMKCQVDSADIEADGDGYELDDIFCEDGQYDMDMNASFEVVGKKKE